MNLTPVESSNVAAIGYLDDERILLVRYRDGSLYAYVGVSAQQHEALMASSKGLWLRNHRDKFKIIVIAKGVMPSEPAVPSGPTSAVEPGGNAAPSPGPLNVIDEDADKCCRRQLTSFFGGPPSTAEHFECSACGTTFKPMMVGQVKVWAIVPLFAVHRMKR